MATLNDIRDAGFDVQLAWKGDTTPDVYAISRKEIGLSYLPDDPDALDAFLAQLPDESESNE